VVGSATVSAHVLFIAPTFRTIGSMPSAGLGSSPFQIK
jgi:hypothetical protein